MWATPAQRIMRSMFNDHILRTLSHIRMTEAQQVADRARFEPRGGPAPRKANRAEASEGRVTVRHATAIDFDALGRLAARESRRIPSGELYVAERGGRLVAAVSIDTGAVIADPTERTSEIVELLRLQASAASSGTARPIVLDTAEPALPKAA
jgi:hypothetical protein